MKEYRNLQTIALEETKSWKYMYYLTVFCAALIIQVMPTEAQNLALSRPATHSGTYVSNETANGASNAVDGNEDTLSLTSSNQPAWWQVQLEGDYIIQNVTIIAAKRGNEYRLLQTLLITVKDAEGSSRECARFNNATSNNKILAPLARLELTCAAQTVGNTVVISRDGGNETTALAMAEVIVKGILLTGNQALEKTTRQIETYMSYNSSYAVDRDSASCAIADKNQERSWWQVDLGYEFSINSVRIFATVTAEAYRYIEDIEITVDGTDTTSSQRICVTYPGRAAVNNLVNITLNCTSPLQGRYVTIRRRGSGHQPKTLGLCDVQVFGDYIDPTRTSTYTSTTTSTMSPTTSKSTTMITSPTIVTTPSPTTVITPSTATISIPSKPGESTTSDSGDSSSTSPTSSKGPMAQRGLSDGAIAGIVVGSFVALVVMVLLLLCLVRYRRMRFRRSNSDRKSLGLNESQEHNMGTINGVRGGTMRPPKQLSPTSSPTSSLRHNYNRTIAKSKLRQYVENSRSLDEGFKAEFKELPDEDLMHTTTLGKQKTHKKKNRFQNIVPYDNNTVPLVSDDKSADLYINGSYITGYGKVEKKYIATQGPTNDSINDFWNMIWQQNADLIVMITQIFEKGGMKCAQYWPESLGEKTEFGKFKVATELQDEFADYAYREFKLQHTGKPNEEARTVRHMHFLSWRDKSAPEHCFPILSFHRQVQKLDTGKNPLVVHCSAGVGRTGTFICIDYLLKQLKAEGEISVFHCVEQLRSQRMKMVQTVDQYTFIYEALLETVEIGEGTAISCDNLQNHYKGFKDGGKMKHQFSMLQEMRCKVSKDRPSAGDLKENLTKNRQKNVLAFDDCRPHLDVIYSNGGSGYINAVYVNSYRTKNNYILTQCPLPNTVTDFWSLVWEQKIQTIILLDEIDGSDSTCPQYWPAEVGNSVHHGSIEVTQSSFHTEGKWVEVWELSMSCKKDKKVGPLKVRLYKLCKAWPTGANHPSDSASLLELKKKVGYWQSQLQTDSTTGKEGKIILQCIDGYTRCGFMAAALLVLDRMIMQSEVDVFLSCRYVICNRPEAIDSMEQYANLHELALTSASNFDNGQDYYNCNS